MIFLLSVVCSFFIIIITTLYVFRYLKYDNKYYNLEGKYVLITGGANGLGREMAFLFAKYKANVLIWDISQRDIDNTVNEINVSFGGEAGVCAYGYLCDVGNAEDIQNCTKKILNDGIKVNILVNNAAVVFGENFLDSTSDHDLRSFAVNICGPCFVCRSFLNSSRHHLDNIVFISSTAAYAGLYRLGAYCSSKAALSSFTECLRHDLKEYDQSNVRIILVAPHFIEDTGLFKGVAIPWYVRLFCPTLHAKDVAVVILDSIRKPWSMDSFTIPFLLGYILPFLKLAPAFAIKIGHNIIGARTALNNWKGRGNEWGMGDIVS